MPKVYIKRNFQIWPNCPPSKARWGTPPNSATSLRQKRGDLCVWGGEGYPHGGKIPPNSILRGSLTQRRKKNFQSGFRTLHILLGGLIPLLTKLVSLISSWDFYSSDVYISIHSCFFKTRYWHSDKQGDCKRDVTEYVTAQSHAWMQFLCSIYRLCSKKCTIKLFGNSEFSSAGPAYIDFKDIYYRCNKHNTAYIDHWC